MKLIRFPKSKRNNNYALKVNAFREKAHSSLFDIAACKCKILSTCLCEKSRKVSVKEQTFILDQRTARKMVIGAIDIVETERLTKSKVRKSKKVERQAQIVSPDNAKSPMSRCKSDLWLNYIKNKSMTIF